MTWPLAIDTPLGPPEVALTCGIVPAGAPDVEVTLPSGALVAVWHDVAGVTVDLLLTRYDGSAVVPEGYVAPECWGMEWRLHSRDAWTAPMVLSVLLPEGAEASADADEDIQMAEFWPDDWRLCLGGSDEVWFARRVKDAGLAPSWGEVFSEAGDGGLGGLGPHLIDRGLVWYLPGLRPGESAKVRVAVAWCPADAPEADNAANFAVDVSPAFLRAAAGVPDPRPSRR